MERVSRELYPWRSLLWQSVAIIRLPHESLPQPMQRSKASSEVQHWVRRDVTGYSSGPQQL